MNNSVYNILRNEKYSGVYRHGDEIIDNMYPQIVPTNIFNQVRHKVTENKYGKKSTKIDFLLRQKVFCANGQEKLNQVNHRIKPSNQCQV